MYHAACKVEFQPSNGRTHSWRFSVFYKTLIYVRVVISYISTDFYQVMFWSFLHFYEMQHTHENDPLKGATYFDLYSNRNFCLLIHTFMYSLPVVCHASILRFHTLSDILILVWLSFTGRAGSHLNLIACFVCYFNSLFYLCPAPTSQASSLSQLRFGVT